MYNVKCIMNNVHYTLYIISLGGFYKCALSDFEIVFEDKLKVVEWSVAGYVTDTTCNLAQKESKRW